MPVQQGPEMCEGPQVVEAFDGGMKSRLVWSHDGGWLAALSAQQSAGGDSGGTLLRWKVWESEFGLRIPFSIDDHPLPAGMPTTPTARRFI